MSSTKILIVVLILITLLFVFFVIYGAAVSEEPKAGNRNDAAEFSRNGEAPGWSKTISSLFSSMKPTLELKKKVYSGSSEEDIAPDDKQVFRTATFHLVRGRASIEYEDQTEDIPDELEDLKEQECELPNSESDDPRRCSIVALKRGGKLTFSCQGTDPCRVEVE